jgi:hypothetical protein
MLKLEQIHIVDKNDCIVEVLEPIVYTKVGTIEKTDDIIAKDKSNSFYLIAKVVKTHNEEKEIPVGTFLMVTQPSLAVINFPIEGYDKPTLATLNKATIFAVIQEDNIEDVLYEDNSEARV